MGIMDIVGGIASALQKPQSVATGGAMGLLRALGQDSAWNQDEYDSNKQWVADLQRQGMDTSELEKKLFGGLGGISNPLQGVIAGLQGNIQPSDVMKYDEQQTSGRNTGGVLAQLSNTAADLSLDPLLFAGLASKPLAASGKFGKVGGALDTAFSAGKLGEDATRAEKVGTALLRGARRTYQGTVATGDPLTGLGAGALLGLGENKLAKLLPEALGRATRGVAEVTEDVPSAVQLAGTGKAPEGFDVSKMFGVEKPGMSFDVADMIGTQKPMAGALVPDEVIQAGGRGLPTGGQPMGAIGPATAIEGQVGLRPMGPAPAMAERSFERMPLDPNSVNLPPMGMPTGPVAGASPLDLPAQTIREVLPQDNIIEQLLGPPKPAPRVLMDPMLQGRDKQSIINMLDEILRSNQ